MLMIVGHTVLLVLGMQGGAHVATDGLAIRWVSLCSWCCMAVDGYAWL